MERTYSQKIARGFELADYFLLIPAGFGVVLASMLFNFLTLLVYAFFIVGVVLLAGYYKHSRGKLRAEYFPALWLATAVYNFILLLPCLYWASFLLQAGLFKDEYGNYSNGALLFFLINLAIVGGYLTAIIMAVKAFSFEKRKKYL
jgi:purine-cytosine permease-like protein